MPPKKKTATVGKPAKAGGKKGKKKKAKVEGASLVRFAERRLLMTLPERSDNIFATNTPRVVSVFLFFGLQVAEYKEKDLI